MSRAVVLSAVRTPIGRYGGALSGVRPDDLAALAIREAVARAGVPAEQIEDVWFGAANQAGEDNRNVARMAALLAGLPESVGRRHRQPALRLRARRGRRRLPCRDRGRRRPLRRRRRGVDEPRAVRDAEGREAVRARRPSAVRHDARLALHESEAGRALPARVDGRDGRERGRAVGRDARGSGRVRAPVAAALGGGRRGGPLRRRARPGRRRDPRRASAAGHDRSRSSRRSSRRSARAARSRPATRPGSTTARPRS